MRIRSTGLALFAGLSIFVAACSGGGASSSPAASTPATTAPSADASAPGIRGTGVERGRSRTSRSASSPTSARSTTRTSTSSPSSAPQQGAAAIGADPPPGRRPDAPTRTTRRSSRRSSTRTSTSSWRRASTSSRPPRPRPRPTPTSGSSASTTPRASTRRATSIPTFADCSGDLGALLPKYIAINYAEDQAGYLAGIVAGLATKSNTIGAIGGVSLCGPCIRYIQGYELGAKSVNPDITVKSAFVSDSDFRVGFADQAGRQDVR